jgi:hypothetical protein
MATSGMFRVALVRTDISEETLCLHPGSLTTRPQRRSLNSKNFEVPVGRDSFNFYMNLNFVPHRRHTYGPSRSVTEIALPFFVDDVRTSQEAHL